MKVEDLNRLNLESHFTETLFLNEDEEIIIDLITNYAQNSNFNSKLNCLISFLFNLYTFHIYDYFELSNLERPSQQ